MDGVQCCRAGVRVPSIARTGGAATDITQRRKLEALEMVFGEARRRAGPPARDRPGI